MPQPAEKNFGQEGQPQMWNEQAEGVLDALSSRSGGRWKSCVVRHLDSELQFEGFLLDPLELHFPPKCFLLNSWKAQAEKEEWDFSSLFANLFVGYLSLLIFFY
eukprot:scaffold258_cov258-Ochromonas_danica.AAC.2